mgnify:CR=1 FL=1
MFPLFLAGDVQGIGGISPNFDIPALLRTWLMQMSAGFPLNAMLAGRVRPGSIHPADVLCGVMVAGAAVAALAALDTLPNKKQNLLLFLTGLAMLSAMRTATLYSTSANAFCKPPAAASQKHFSVS